MQIPERPEHRKERVETDLTHLVALAFSTQGHAEGFLTGLQTLAPAELLANVTCSVGVRKVGTCISAVKGAATIERIPPISFGDPEQIVKYSMFPAKYT